jgi:hypothetical protein
MRILLVVDRAKAGPGIWALVWTSADDDPKLLDRSNIMVDWTPALQSDDRLAAAVRECMEAS